MERVVKAQRSSRFLCFLLLSPPSHSVCLSFSVSCLSVCLSLPPSLPLSYTLSHSLSSSSPIPEPIATPALSLCLSVSALQPDISSASFAACIADSSERTEDNTRQGRLTFRWKLTRQRGSDQSIYARFLELAFVFGLTREVSARGGGDAYQARGADCEKW